MTVLLQRAEDVAVEVCARLASRTVALGAETDLGVSVYQGRRRIDDSMIPCAVVIEGPDTAGSAVGARVEVDQPYTLFAYIPCDPANPNVAAHAALRDLKRAIFMTDGKADPRWGGKVREVRYLGRDIGPRADGAAFVVAAIDIGVQYVENLAAP